MDSSVLFKILAEWRPRLDALSEQEAHRIVGSKWSRKEVLGHLLDSAVNNHQRFVRLQEGNLEGFPGYDQETWVNVSRYDQCVWNDLIELWYLYNQHLVRVISHIPSSAETNLWKDMNVDLRFLIQDYSRHLLHHLENMRLSEQAPA